MTEVFPVHNPEQAALDVVFIHGLDGDARKTWSREDRQSFWPQWLVDDIDDVAVWTVDYDAWSSAWRGRSMSLQDRTINLLAQLQNHSIGERALCFVTHSMGGLLAKDLLMHAAEGRTEFASFATVTKGVVFLATPHNGSGLTKAVQALSVLYRGTPAVEDLRRNAPYLRHLSDRYRDWVDEVKIRNLVFFESHPTMGLWVVDEASANPGLPRVPPIPVDANHIDICKPLNRSSLVYGQVRRFVTALHERPVQRERSVGHLTLPTAGATVGTEIVVKGVVDAVPERHHLWIAHQDRRGLFWAKDFEVTPEHDGHFERIVYEGGSLREFTLLLLLASEAGHNQLIDWMAECSRSGSYPGIPADRSRFSVLDKVALNFDPSAK